MVISKEQLDNVKHVLFGNQKQANVINDAVVGIVAEGLLEITHSAALDTESNVVEAIKGYLQAKIDGGPGSDTLVKLVAGEQSFANLSAVGPKTVYAEPISPESPKYNFRIVMLGDQPGIDHEAEARAEQPVLNTSIPYEPGFVPDDVSYTAQADYLKNAILPLLPPLIMQELQDEWKAALVGSQYYFRNNTVKNGSVLSQQPSNANQQSSKVRIDFRKKIEAMTPHDLTNLGVRIKNHQPEKFDRIINTFNLKREEGLADRVLAWQEDADDIVAVMYYERVNFNREEFLKYLENDKRARASVNADEGKVQVTKELVQKITHMYTYECSSIEIISKETGLSCSNVAKVLNKAKVLGYTCGEHDPYTVARVIILTDADRLSPFEISDTLKITVEEVDNILAINNRLFNKK